MALTLAFTNAPLTAFADAGTNTKLKFSASDLAHGKIFYSIDGGTQTEILGSDADAGGAIWVSGFTSSNLTAEIIAVPDSGYEVRGIVAMEGEGGSRPAFNGNFVNSTGIYSFPLCEDDIYDVSVSFDVIGSNPPGPPTPPGPGPDPSDAPANYGNLGYASFGTNGDTSGKIYYTFDTDASNINPGDWTELTAASGYYEPIDMSGLAPTELMFLRFEGGNGKHIDVDGSLDVRADNRSREVRLYRIGGSYNDDPNYDEERDGKQLDGIGLSDCFNNMDDSYIVPLDCSTYSSEALTIEFRWIDVKKISVVVDTASQYMLSNGKVDIGIATGKGFKTSVENGLNVSIPVLEDTDGGGHQERYLVDLKIDPQYFIPEFSFNGNSYRTFDANSGTAEYTLVAAAIPAGEFKELIRNASDTLTIHLTVDRSVGVKDSQGRDSAVVADFRMIDDGDIPSDTSVEDLDANMQLEADKGSLSDGEKANGFVESYEIQLEVDGRAETEFPVEINLSLPGDFSNNYEYKVVREHAGEATVELDCSLEDRGIVFSTDKFSKFSVKKVRELHSHKGIKVNKVDSTCNSYGIKEYYRCACGKNFKNLSCTDEITDIRAWKNSEGRINKKAHTLTTKVVKATPSANGKKETKCSVCASVTKTEVIYAPKSIKLSATEYAYDGKAKKPTVTVKDSKGNKVASSSYDVSYASGRKNVGSYTVKITFKGNYSGSKKLEFVINPPKTSLSKVSAGKKAFTAKWSKKTSQVTGYEIQYSTSSKFEKGNKTVTIKSADTTSKEVSKLKAKTKYYVRVRTYKSVGGKTFYSDWSSAKNVTTKN